MTPAEARRLLGLRRDVHDPELLRRAYRHAVRRHHPDRADGDAVRFRQSVVAFELLAAAMDQAIVPMAEATESPPTTPTPPDPSTRLDVLMVGLDRVGEVTYLDRSLALVEGVLPHPDGALQVLIAGGGDGNARVVDVTRLDGGSAPTADEIHQLLTEATPPN
jgi:hypothetical protein